MLSVFILSIFSWWIVNSNNIYEKIAVTTDHGEVVGIKKDVLGNSVYCFLGIPFAKPPIGRLRFRKPEPMDAWNGIKFATQMPKACYQNPPAEYELSVPFYRMWVNNTEISEDCLYLNIWTPTIGTEKNDFSTLQTMVWIHGGDFIKGSSTLDVYNGEILSSKMDIIVISIQYRLGAFGFLSFNSEEAPGNQGLMDQVLALEWINANIAKFGGNNKRITIFGQNAGAISVSLHLLSPLTQKLFNRAIMQSDSALSWWAFDDPKTAIENAYEFADLCGCKNPINSYLNRSHNLLECLRYLDPQTIIINQEQIKFSENAEKRTRKNLLKQLYPDQFMSHIIPSANSYFQILFKPINESEYLPMSPINYLTKNGTKINKKAIMLGVTKNEGLLHLIKGLKTYFLPNGRTIKPNVIDTIDIIALYLLHNQLLQKIIVQAIEFEYQVPSRFQRKTYYLEKEDVLALDNIVGDYMVKCPLIQFADLYMMISKVYLYSFEHETKHLTLPKWMGVLQGQEIPYVFGKPFDKEFNNKYFNFTKDEKDISLNIMTMWKNFAEIGYPNHKLNEYVTIKRKNYWEPYMESTLVYLEQFQHLPKSRNHIVFRNKTFYYENNLRRHECLFWRDVLQKYQFTSLSDTKCPSLIKEKSMKRNREAENKTILLNQKSHQETDTQNGKKKSYCHQSFFILFTNLLFYVVKKYEEQQLF